MSITICVFYRNEENEMKSKQFRKELKKLFTEEVVITTTGFYGRDHKAKSGDYATKMECGHDHKRQSQQILNVVATTTFTLQRLSSSILVVVVTIA